MKTRFFTEIQPKSTENFFKSYDYNKLYDEAENIFTEIKETGEEVDIRIEEETYSDKIGYEFVEYNYQMRTKQLDKKLVYIRFQY